MKLIFLVFVLGFTHSASHGYAKTWEEEVEDVLNFATDDVFNKITTPYPITKHNRRENLEETFFVEDNSTLTREETNIYFNNMHYTYSPWHLGKRFAEENHTKTDPINNEQQKGNIFESWEVDPEMLFETATHELMHILLWTKNADHSYKWDEMDFPHFGGQQIFIDKKCPNINCYVTDNRSYFQNDFSKFNAIVFIAPDVFSVNLPWNRAPHQKYIFATIESSDNYPVCSNAFNGYFNWTWTYKIDSDARWGYIFVRDSKHRIIGPRIIMNWIPWKKMTPIGKKLKKKLKSKTKAAAWFVSNCWTQSHREDYVRELQKELSKYDLVIDIYGQCAEWECGKHRHADCLKMLEKDYFFYLSFENGLSEDYVTEKLLHPLQSNTVPIVFGGANYSRFMPDGMYLNARELGVKKLASTMRHLMQHPEEYYDYFRWKNHYSFHGNKQLDVEGYCRICTMLNNIDLMTQTSVYENFRDWWNPPGRC